MLNSIETVKTINTYVKKEIPFLFIIDFEKENNIVLPINELTTNNIFFKTPSLDNIPEIHHWPELNFFEKTPISLSDYEVLFSRVSEEIQRGNSFLLNLTVPTPVKCNLDLFEIFLVSKAKFKLYFQDCFTLFSPETFVFIEDEVIKTFPMKGTIKANIPNAAEIIMSNTKEAAEHATIVDLLRNDLSTIARDVTVSRFRYMETVETNYGPIYQVSSEIQGKLPENFRNNLGEILFSMLPAGSVTGAPKAKTVSIIRETELCSRGYYTGIFGTWDTRKLESAVMIRFIRKEHEQLWYHSGGGITFQSDCLTEYNEMTDKVYVPVC